MNLAKDVKKHIFSVLNGGDILFIIPPFAIRGYAVLGPHILQAIAEEMGYKADILYANILLVSIIGEGMYDKISELPYNLRWMKLGERLFARSAYGFPPLGKTPEWGVDEAMCITGNRQDYGGVSYESTNIGVESFSEVEEICTSFIHEITQVLTAIDYSMIGCTTTLEQTNCSVALLQEIKKCRPDIITLIGGANCSGKMAEGIASLTESIDYVFSGESELALKEFLKAYSEGKLPLQRIIPGKPLKDLNTLPSPNYGSFFSQVKQFLGEKAPKYRVISYETSRGCWRRQKGKCYFCGNNNTSHIIFRQKSEEKVIHDLERIAESYPVDGILMTDNIVPHSYYEKLLPLLSERKSFPPIWYQENANLKLKDLINLKQTRINCVLAGIEALSNGLLKLMNKGISARQNLFLLRNALSVGIYISWHMLWGFPGDKVAHYEETLKLLPLIRHFHPPRELVHLILARFSSYVEHPQEHQITNLRPLEVYKKIYPDWAEIESLAYEFSADYPCEAHENPKVIQELAQEIRVWKKVCEKSTLTMIPFANYYMIHDSRGINGKDNNHILEYSQAKEIMTYGIYNESEAQKWAVEQKLGVILDSWYVPLVTASPELLLTFED